MSRCGVVALAGRPNVGKSTFINRAVGAKVAIVCDRPQTTRRAIRAARSNGASQIVLIDLPGVQRPRDPLTARMAGRVQRELDSADMTLLMLNGEQGVGPGDRFIAQTLATARVPVTIALNKVDRLSRAATLNGLVQAAELAPDAEVFPISARTGLGVEALLAHLFSMLPEGPFLLGADQASDQPLVLLLGELVREAAIKRTFQELPHAVEAEVAEISRPRAGLTRVEAALWVETESQKGILIGRGGSMVRAIGTAARRELERELGGHVQLDLAVRVRRHWRADEALLDRLQIS